MAVDVFGSDGYHQSWLLRQILTPAAVGANTTAEQIVTLNSPPTGMQQFLPVAFVDVNKPTAQAGLGIVGARVIDPSTVGITFANTTAGAITPTAGEVYTFIFHW